MPADCAAEEAPLYRSFCRTAVYDGFCQLSKDVRDLMAVAAHLWPLYVQPLRSGKVQAACCDFDHHHHFQFPTSGCLPVPVM